MLVVQRVYTAKQTLRWHRLSILVLHSIATRAPSCHACPITAVNGLAGAESPLSARMLGTSDLVTSSPISEVSFNSLRSAGFRTLFREHREAPRSNNQASAAMRPQCG